MLIYGFHKIYFALELRKCFLSVAQWLNFHGSATPRKLTSYQNENFCSMVSEYLVINFILPHSAHYNLNTHMHTHNCNCEKKKKNENLNISIPNLSCIKEYIFVISLGLRIYATNVNVKINSSTFIQLISSQDKL